MQKVDYNANFRRVEDIARVLDVKALDLLAEVPDPEPLPDENVAKKASKKKAKKKAGKKAAKKTRKKKA